MWPIWHRTGWLWPTGASVVVGLHAGVFTSRTIFMKLILHEKSLNLKTGCNGVTFIVILKKQTEKWRAWMIEKVFGKLKNPQDLTREKKKLFFLRINWIYLYRLKKTWNMCLQQITLNPSGLTLKAGELSRGGKATHISKSDHQYASPTGSVVPLDHCNWMLG